MERRTGFRFIAGSSAPKYEEPVRIKRIYENAQEEQIERTPQEEARIQRREYIRRNRRKAARFGGLYTAFICAAVAVTFAVCVNFLKTINTKAENSKELISLQNELSALKEDNELKQLAINTSIDYNYVYDVATEELGMVYPGEGHIVNYTGGISEYVLQYSDINK